MPIGILFSVATLFVFINNLTNGGDGRKRLNHLLAELMAINTTKRSLLEETIDTVSLKSGLILPQNKALNLLGEEYAWLGEDLDGWIRIYPDEVEDLFVNLMYAIGAISDSRGSVTFLIDYVKKNSGHFKIDPSNLMHMNAVVQELTIDLQAYILDSIPLSAERAGAPDFGRFIDGYLCRESFLPAAPREKSWNSCIPLSALFESEAIEGDNREECYFDQRYIDYLARQTRDLNDIHWRQFEYLTAEFFRRSGYTVEINSGRKDGGVDVVVKKMDSILGPELIYVQCKKYGEKKPIQLDAVRSFWATISDENASKGIIATTSRLTKGAKDYCNARLYRLCAIEQDKIRAWIEGMKQ